MCAEFFLEKRDLQGSVPEASLCPCKAKASRFSEMQIFYFLFFFQKWQIKLSGLFFFFSHSHLPSFCCCCSFVVVVVFLDIVPSQNSGFRLIFPSLNFKCAGSALAFSRCQIC